jgi:hypothetical protein|tara:strand:+ start:405 stop:554 length:150 start_codon:yes stop_codon:yes gene_type:complete
MKKEYDFPQGERGKLCRLDAEINIFFCFDAASFSSAEKNAEKEKNKKVC